jgi:hypothetical protein
MFYTTGMSFKFDPLRTAINPFLTLINDHLRGLQIGTARTSTACIAYADDVTVVIQNEQDIKSLNAIIQLYTQATGASINWDKSSALPLGQSRIKK